MGLLWSFFKRFLRYRRQLLLGFLCIPLANLADIGITLLIGNALDRLRTATDAEFLRGLMFIFAGLALVHGIFRYLQRWWIVVVSRRFEIDLKQELFDKLTSLSFGFHNRSRSGDVVSRLTSDVENLRMFLGPGIMYSLGAAVLVPVSLGLLLTLNAKMALVMVLPMVLMGLAMKVFAPTLHRHSVQVQESLADISHRAQENFSGIRVVKGYHREAQQAERFATSSAKNRDNQISLAHARGLTHAAVNGANNLTFVVILVFGSLALIDRSLSDGDLFKFIDLTFKVFWPLIALGWIAGMYPRAVASAQRVTDLLAEEPDIKDPEHPVEMPHVRGELALENVSFTYEGAREPTLQDISVRVPSGSTLGIVGPTGSGKSTLLRLFGRLFEPEGDVRLDGVPIQDMSLETLRGSLGYVPQDSFLFSEPYRDNIQFGADEDLSDERIRELVQAVSMDREVDEFEHGLDQLIGERGVTLSGGQRQRTCIARALAKNPRVLVLDDCLSAVDTETEKRLLGNLRSAGHGRTVVVAAHRLTTVSDADQILVLAGNGELEALGDHADLLAREGWYQRTWKQQQREEELQER